MAFQISLNSNTSEISRVYHESIELGRPYKIALQSFVTFNTIPNISEENKNNELVLIDEVAMTDEHFKIIIPTGAYELQDIFDFIQNYENVPRITFSFNKNTLKVRVESDWAINFRTRNSIGKLLGFSPIQIDPKQVAYSDLPIDIFKVNTIKIKCNIVQSNFHDLKRYDRTLYEFPLDTELGGKLIERPHTLSYYPLNTADEIHELHIRIVDQDDELVDFRNEKICLTLSFCPI